jgi:hypothetical protein
MFLHDYCDDCYLPAFYIKDMSRRPVGSPLASGEAKRKQFALSIKNNVELLMKLRERC